MANKEYLNSELCQKCAKCCKVWWLYTNLEDDAVRASWLDTDKVSVIKVKEDLWRITFHMLCKQLIKRDDRYHCKQHGGFRPQYCKEFPVNFLEAEPEALELEKKFCPALRMDFIKQKLEVRNGKQEGVIEKDGNI